MSFFAYSRIENNHYRERFGLDFEDFTLGQRFHHRPGITLSQQDNVDEALDTMNAAMIHYDANYAAETSWKKELMVSTVTLQRLIGMSSKTFGRKQRLVRFSEIAMTHPVFGGDTLYAESEIVALNTAADPALGELSVICHARNQDGREVARLSYAVLVWRHGLHPEDAAGEREPLNDDRFLAHRRQADDSYIEQAGLFFEDCEPGESITHWPRRSLLRDEGLEHTWRSLELAPQYHDLQWIDQFADGNFRFTESWLIGIVTAMTTRTFGRVVANLGWTDIEFGVDPKPGDTLEACSKILDKRESKSRPNEGIIHVDTRAHDQSGALVLSYQRRLLVYKRDADTPYGAAGY